MAKQEKSSKKFPQKTKTYPDGSTVTFKKLDDGFPSAIYYYPPGGGYQELYPSVYSIEIPDEGYTKLYDFFVEEYFENRGIISYDQYCLQNYIATLRNRGYYLALKGRQGKDDDDSDVKGLAQIVGMRINTLIANLDHLEDCLLLHRVRRLDLHGAPNELVVHSPFTAKQLDAGKEKVIVDRIARSHTKTRRQQAVVKGSSLITRGGFGYLDRKATPERFQFNYQFIKNAFGENAKTFADFALEFFKKHLAMLRRDKREFDYAYRADLNRKLSDWAIGGNSARETCYIAANKFRVIYCPTDEEICA